MPYVDECQKIHHSASHGPCGHRPDTLASALSRPRYTIGAPRRSPSPISLRCHRPVRPERRRPACRARHASRPAHLPVYRRAAQRRWLQSLAPERLRWTSAPLVVQKVPALLRHCGEAPSPGQSLWQDARPSRRSIQGALCLPPLGRSYGFTIRGSGCKRPPRKRAAGPVRVDRAVEVCAGFDVLHFGPDTPEQVQIARTQGGTSELTPSPRGGVWTPP